MSCPKEALFIESGVKEEESAMLLKFFFPQWKYGVQNDWTDQLRIDYEDFGISEDLDFVKSKSEYSFKKIIKVKAQECALHILNLRKKSKMENTFPTKMNMQGYLKSKDVHTEDKQLVFVFRKRMEKSPTISVFVICWLWMKYIIYNTYKLQFSNFLKMIKCDDKLTFQPSHLALFGP